MRRRAPLLLAVLMLLGLVGPADAAQPGPTQLPAVQLTVADECTGAAIPGASVSISDPAGATVSPSSARGSSFTFDRLDLADAQLHVSASGHQPLGDPATPNPGVWLYTSTDDFALWLAPDSGTVAAGGSLTSAVLTQTMQGLPQSIALSVTGAPAGVTASVGAPSVTAPGAATMSIATTATTVAGSYPLTVTGTAGSGSHAAVFMLTVTKTKKATSNDFSLGLSPAGGNVIEGTTATTTVSSTITQGAAQALALSVSGLPSGVTASFDATSIASGQSVQLTFSATATAATGLAKVTVSGAAASGTRSLVYRLFVAGGTKAPPKAKSAVAYSSPDVAAAARPIARLDLTDGSSVTESLVAAVMLEPVTGCATHLVPKVNALSLKIKNPAGVITGDAHVRITSDISTPDLGVTGVQASGTMQFGSGEGEGKRSFQEIAIKSPNNDVHVGDEMNADAYAHLKVRIHWDRVGTRRGAIAVGVAAEVAVAAVGQNRPPVIDWIATDAAGATAGNPITFSAAAHDPDAEPVTAAWSATPACPFANPTNLTTTITCANPGAATVTLTVTDPHGASASQTLSVFYLAANPPELVPVVP
jgi:PKD domain